MPRLDASVSLELPENYAWKKLLLLYTNSHCLEPTEFATPKKGILEGIVELPKPYWYRIEQKERTLELSLTAPDGAKKPSKKDYETLRAWAIKRFWLGLDMEALREALEVNFYGFSLAEQFWPVVSPCYTGYWNALLRIYCGQKFDQNLRQALGSKVHFAGKEYSLLPTPEQMLEVGSLELRAIGLSSWSSRKLPHISQTFVADEALQPGNLPDNPGQALTLIHKRFELGSTSAAWVVMRGVIHPDVALEGSHIRRALAEGLGLEKTPKVAEYYQLMQIHAPYRSFASYYIHLSRMAIWRKSSSLDVG